MSALQAESDFSSRLNDLKIEIGRLLERVLLSSRAIDKESLCLAKGQLAWMIIVNAEILSYDGNLIDPTCISILLALKNLKSVFVPLAGSLTSRLRTAG